MPGLRPRDDTAPAAGKTVSIRPYQASDWPALWPMLRETFSTGDTYTFPSDCAEEDIAVAWTQEPMRTFVACDASRRIVGTYYIKPNHTGNGAHVCNCGYVVSQAARGQGIASRMCEHSQAIARDLGFLAMQFNFVIATNSGAVRLWQRLGFEIVGTLPRAFRHPEVGLVDAYVMYKWLAHP